MAILSRPIDEGTTFQVWMEAYGSYGDDRVIFTKDDVEYVTDSKDHPRYITAFKQGEGKVGSLSLGREDSTAFNGKKYLRIDGVDVHKKHRRERIGLNLYIAALKILHETGYGGLLSRDEDVAAKKFVKRIRQILGAYNPDKDNPGLWLIDARRV